MKIVLSVFLGIAIIGCVVFGIGFSGAQGSLNKTKAQLETTQTELAGTQAELTNAQTELSNAQVELQDTEAQLAVIASELENTQSKLNEMTAQVEAVNESSAVFYDSYTALRQEINVKLGLNADCELIVTPDDPTVATRVKAVAGNFSSDWDEVWRDYQRMYQWVVDNIEYSYDSPLPRLPESPDGALTWMSEYWKLPSETLDDKVGDCEDMAGLLASMMSNYNDREYRVWAVVIRDNNGDGHVAVVLPVVDNQIAIFDPAGNYYSGQSTGSVQSYDIYKALRDWLSYWSSDMPGAKITEAFSYDFYHEFTETQEFIDWAVGLD